MVSDEVPVRPPVDVVRPVAAPDVPGEHHWPSGPTRYEIKADGWRAVGAVLEEHRTVLLSRQGTNLAPHFPEILDALRHCPVGTVLDGELCAVVEGGRMDFDALASRRGRDRRSWPPVVFVVFDLLATTGQDLRPRPLQERLERLGALLPPPPTPLQPVLATTSRAEALAWYEALRPNGVEGLVAKGLGTPYIPGRAGWVKIRHTLTVDAPIVAIAGPAARPTHVTVRLADGTEAETNQLATAQRPAVGRAVAGALGTPLPGGRRRVNAEVIAEVAVGTTRHRTLRFVRLREDLLPFYDR
ncbi:DNA ligase [Streptomyces tendae]|uniref:ATP-dependent DNA ligase n=1 Tax=Streptomyces tendae TaxID=1932 RepID=UPI003EBCA058